MRIVFDLDGLITMGIKDPLDDYGKLSINREVVKKIKGLKKKGHEIIIYTARRMKTYSGNLGKIIANETKNTIEWLDKNRVPYDEVYFGKPYADLYVDDQSINLSNFSKIDSIFPILIIPLAGEGKRLKVMSKQPKPFLLINNKPILQYSLESLQDNKSDFVFVVYVYRNNLKAYHNTIKRIHKNVFGKLPYYEVILSKKTKGQANTVYLAIKKLKLYKEDNPIVVYNCDTHTKIYNFMQSIIRMKLNNVQGIVGVYRDENYKKVRKLKYSYIHVDKFKNVHNITEKKNPSKYISTGLYIFNNANVYLSVYKKWHKKIKQEYGEEYIGPLMNYLLPDINICYHKFFYPLGTPKEISLFANRKR